MSKRLIALMAGLLLVTAVVIVGCGDGDDEATASSITKAEFIKQADTICKESSKQAQVDFRTYLEQVVRAEEESGNAQKPNYPQIVATVMAPGIEQEVEELRDLGVPTGDEDEVEAMIAAREADLETAEAQPARLTTEGEKVFARSSRLAQEYGLKACGIR